jgi:hypothetical protein
MSIKMKKMNEEMINKYVDGVVNLLKEQRDSLDDLIIKCEEIRINILNEINNPKG